MPANTTTDADTADAPPVDLDAAEGVDSAAEDSASEVDTPDEPDESDTDEPGEVGKLRKEAAKHRARAKEAEADRDALAVQLEAQRRAVIDWRATDANVDPALLDAAGIDVSELLTEDGTLDMAAVDEFLEDTAKRFRLQRGFAPNPAQGQSGGDAPSKTLADVFRR